MQLFWEKLRIYDYESFHERVTAFIGRDITRNLPNTSKLVGGVREKNIPTLLKQLEDPRRCWTAKRRPVLTALCLFEGHRPHNTGLVPLTRR